jgi:hypothetical protein
MDRAQDDDGVLEASDGVSYGTTTLERGVSVTGFSSYVTRKRKIGSAGMRNQITARAQVERVIEVSEETEAIAMIRAFFVQHLVIASVRGAPYNIKASLNDFLVSLIQNILVLGYAAVTFHPKTGTPIIVPANMYTPLTRTEYEEQFVEEMEEMPAWRKKAFGETHFAVCDNLIVQDTYWHPVIGPPIMVIGNYCTVQNGYPASPLAELIRTTDFGRVMHSSNMAAAINSVHTEAYFVSGSILSPKMLTMGDETVTLADTIRTRNRARNDIIYAQIQQDKKADMKLTTQLTRTRIRTAAETQMLQFRPAPPLGIPRATLFLMSIETIMRAYGIDPTALHMPASAMRSAHVNMKDAENRQNAVLQMHERLDYGLNVWKVCAGRIKSDIPAEDVNAIELPIPIAGDVVAMLMDRLVPGALARLLEPMVPVTDDDFVGIEDGAAPPPAKKHKKINAMP